MLTLLDIPNPLHGSRLFRYLVLHGEVKTVTLQYWLSSNAYVTALHSCGSHSNMSKGVILRWVNQSNSNQFLVNYGRYFYFPRFVPFLPKSSVQLCSSQNNHYYDLANRRSVIPIVRNLLILLIHLVAIGWQLSEFINSCHWEREFCLSRPPHPISLHLFT